MRTGQCGYALDADKWLWQTYQIVHVATDGPAQSFCCANIGTCCYLKQLSFHKQWCCHCSVDKLSFILYSAHHGCWQLHGGEKRTPSHSAAVASRNENSVRWRMWGWKWSLASIYVAIWMSKCPPWTVVNEKKRSFHFVEGSKVTLKDKLLSWNLYFCIDSLYILSITTVIMNR